MRTRPAELDKLGLAGITQIADSKRFYPEGESAAHVVGFTDIEDQGQEGVELAANPQLIGEAGQREVIRDRLGRAVSDTRPLVPAHNGATIRLTIDRRIQQLAYAQLKAAIAKHSAEAGSVVVLDARNGEILALANYPSFDPNDRTRLSGAAIAQPRGGRYVRAGLDDQAAGRRACPWTRARSARKRSSTPRRAGTGSDRR